jgi:hypothetical protein
MKGGENEVGKIRVKEERTLEVSIFRGNQNFSFVTEPLSKSKGEVNGIYKTPIFEDHGSGGGVCQFGGP